MEKTVDIGGKKVKFKNSASVLTTYKAQTGRDLLSDLQKMQTGETNTEALTAIAWSMAKAADKSTAPLDEWLDEFELIELLEALPEVYSLMNASLKTDRKNA